MFYEWHSTYLAAIPTPIAYIKQITDEFNVKMLVSNRCLNSAYGWHEDTGTQYWLIGLIVIMIFFICVILFGALRLPWGIISLIPVSFIGAFYFSGVELKPVALHRWCY